MGNILFFCLGKNLQVHFEGHSIQGRLIHLQEEDPATHRPLILILLVHRGRLGTFVIVRSWDLISF